MGIFTNIRDNIKVASLSKKEGPFRIEELAKLNEKQLMKLLNKKGSIEIYLVTYKKYYFKDIDIISKIIKLSQLPDFDKIKNIIIEFDNNDLVNIFKNNDINSIKEVLQEEYLNIFLLGKNKMNIEYLEPEFIDKNKDKLLIGKLPSELLKKFYRKALTNDDIFNNIELFSSIELFKEYNLSNLVIDDYLKLLLSKINLDGLNEILNNQRDVFLDKFKYYTTNTNTEYSKKFIEILKTDNIDTFKELTNFIYDLNDSRIYDLPSDKENKERVTQLINKIGKNNIYNYLKENMSSSFFEDKDNMKNFMEYIYNFIISKKLKINENNLSEINNLLDLALLEFRKCYDYKLIKNNDKNKRFFLPNDAPEELKKKFYSKTMTYTDLLNNIEYFNDTNMSLGLWWHNYAKGVFDNDFLLQLLKSTNGNLDAVYIEHLKNIGFEKINYEKYVELLEKYFEEHRFTYEVLQQLKQLNIKLSNIDEIENNIKNSGMMIESLYATDIRLFSNNIVNNFGYDVIRTIAEFHRTNAMDLFIKYTQNSNELERIRNWFIYLSENDILNKKTIIKSILSYENCIDLIDNLLNNNIKLTDSQRSNLSSILDIENRYNVKNTEELSNYQKHKEDILKDKFNSDNIGYVKGAIYEILFNDFLVTNIFLDYKISYIEYFKYNFVDTELIEPNLLAAITIIDNIKKFNGSPDELRDKYQQIIKVGTLYNAQELRAELDKLYTKLWNNSMFNHKENSYSKKFDVKGIDGDVCRYDAFGNLISSNDNIDVYELDGEPFKLIVHSFKPGKTPDESFRSIGEKLYENPSAWNMVDGSTTLSTSLISDKHIATFQPYDDENAVFYGFNNVPSDVIKACKNGDGGTGHGGGYFTFNSELVTPDNLIKNSTMHNYNEVVLFRKSILENNSFDGKVQPTCIVCFDGKINEASKLAAQYFRVPIYMINVKKYRSDYMNNFTKYCEGNIDKFDNQDINYLLSLPNSYDVDTCDLCLSLCDKAFNEGIINCNEYYDRLCYMYYVIAKTCLYRKKVKIILKNKIEEARQIMEESKNDGIRRQ